MIAGRALTLAPVLALAACLKGGFDDVFPADERWTDPADEGAN